MSSSSPEIIFYQGLRCTKVLRQPRATTTTTSSQPSSTSETTTHHDSSVSDTEPPSVTSSSKSSTITDATVTASSASSESSTGNGHQNIQPQSSGLASSLDPSETSTTLTTEFLGATPTSTLSSQSIPELASDHDSDFSLAPVLGSVFGALGFIALLFLLFFLCFRRRNPAKRRSGWSVGGSEKLLRGRRASVDSASSLRPGYQSGMSFFSDVSPARSTLNVLGAGGTSADQGRYRDQVPSPQDNPFSDAAEIPQGMERVVTPALIPISPTDPSNAAGPSTGPPPMSETRDPSVMFPFHYDLKRPESAHTSDSGSIHESIHSLGSTIILPGRSSIGSSIQRNSFPFPMPPDTGPSLHRVSVIRVSARSDPFDLDIAEYPDSGTLPSGL